MRPDGDVDCTAGNTAPTLFATVQSRPFGVISDGTNVYWVNGGPGTPGNGSIAACTISTNPSNPGNLAGSGAQKLVPGLNFVLDLAFPPTPMRPGCVRHLLDRQRAEAGPGRVPRHEARQARDAPVSAGARRLSATTVFMHHRRMRQPLLRAAPFALAALTCAAFGPRPAHADDNSAAVESLFSEGRSLMAAGKVAEACRSALASYTLEHRVGTLLSLADCYEQNRRNRQRLGALHRGADPRDPQQPAGARRLRGEARGDARASAQHAHRQRRRQHPRPRRAARRTGRRSGHLRRGGRGRRGHAHDERQRDRQEARVQSRSPSRPRRSAGPTRSLRSSTPPTASGAAVVAGTSAPGASSSSTASRGLGTRKNPRDRVRQRRSRRPRPRRGVRRESRCPTRAARRPPAPGRYARRRTGSASGAALRPARTSPRPGSSSEASGSSALRCSGSRRRRGADRPRRSGSAPEVCKSRGAGDERLGRCNRRRRCGAPRRLRGDTGDQRARARARRGRRARRIELAKGGWDGRRHGRDDGTRRRARRDDEGQGRRSRRRASGRRGHGRPAPGLQLHEADPRPSYAAPRASRRRTPDRAPSQTRILLMLRPADEPRRRRAGPDPERVEPAAHHGVRAERRLPPSRPAASWASPQIGVQLPRGPRGSRAAPVEVLTSYPSMADAGSTNADSAPGPSRYPSQLGEQPAAERCLGARARDNGLRRQEGRYQGAEFVDLPGATPPFRYLALEATGNGGMSSARLAFGPGAGGAEAQLVAGVYNSSGFGNIWNDRFLEVAGDGGGALYAFTPASATRGRPSTWPRPRIRWVRAARAPS